MAPLNLVSQTRLDSLSRDRCSNTPFARCSSGYRKLSLLYPLLQPQEGPTAVKGLCNRGGLSPKFSETIGGKSALENRAFSGLIGPLLAGGRREGSSAFKAKSPFFLENCRANKGKRAKCPEKGLDYQILPSYWFNSGTDKVPERTLCDKDVAGLPGELSGAICLKNPAFIDY